MQWNGENKQIEEVFFWVEGGERGEWEINTGGSGREISTNEAEMRRHLN